MAARTTVLALVCLCLVTTACLVESKEDKLVGEWQCDKPRFVHLKIEKGATFNDDFDLHANERPWYVVHLDSGTHFHEGFSYTDNGGPTQTRYWRVWRDERSGDFDLLLSAPTKPLGGILEDTMMTYARHHRIIDLTSEKLVIYWDSNVFDERSGGVYEFHRIR